MKPETLVSGAVAVACHALWLFAVVNPGVKAPRPAPTAGGSLLEIGLVAGAPAPEAAHAAETPPNAGLETASGEIEPPPQPAEPVAPAPESVAAPQAAPAAPAPAAALKKPAASAWSASSGGKPARRGSAAAAQGKGSGQSNGDGSLTLPARYLHTTSFALPEEARRLGQSGRVLLLVEVNASGAPVNITIGQSSGVEILDKAAIREVRLWRFEPARRNGVAVDWKVEVPIRFGARGQMH